MNWKEITTLIASIGSVLVVLVSMLWGVPYYVDIKVEQRLAVLNAAAGTPPEVSALQTLVAVNGTKIDAVGATAAANGVKIDNLTTTVIETFTKLSK